MVITTRIVECLMPEWLIRSRWDGVIAIAVTPPSSITSRRVAAFTSRTGSTVPPDISGRKNAQPATSKEIEGISAIRVAASMPPSLMAHWT